MDKRLFKTRNDIYKKCPSIFWAVSFFALIVAIALVALETVVPGLYLITFSFLFFPLLFSTYMTLFTIKYGGTISIKSTFNIAGSYFKRSNFGCFKLIRNFLYALLVEFIAVFIYIFAFHAIFKGIYGASFTNSVQSMLDLVSSDQEGLILFLDDYATNGLNESNLVLFYIDAVSTVALSTGIFVFIYLICYNSTNVYLAASIPNAPASVSNSIHNRFMKNNRKDYFKDFWALNWPMFVLLLIGIVGGYLLVFALDIDFAFAGPISTMIGLACLIPFAPFFFANMEALFNKYNEKMRKASMDLTQGFLKNLKNNVNLSEEDKAKIDELLSKNDENNENKDQGN